MTFQITPLDAELFAHIPSMSDQQLAAANIDRQVVSAFPGTPCRVTLDDATVGETVYLLNWTHLPEGSPYQASHAIFFRPDRKAFTPKPGEIPPVLTRRPISIRGYNSAHRMIDAQLAEGDAIADAIAQMFEIDAVEYIHLHNAKPGCFAAKVVRA
ncbi:MAG: DUF1203 domain-containing protein [Pseudomonadota bacterium]